ncbi:MAG: hypothetical protein ACRDOO_27395 [Actinomadura sp.]
MKVVDLAVLSQAINPLMGLLSGVPVVVPRRLVPWDRFQPSRARFLQGGISMGIRKGAAVAVSGLVLGGAAVLTVGAATPAGAGDHHRGHQSVRIANKNFNFSRSDSQQAQREHQNQRRFDHESDFFRHRG